MSVQDDDAQIAVLEAQLIDLKRKRNDKLPFFTIPSELIIRIIKLSRGWDPRYENTSSLSAWRNVDLRGDHYITDTEPEDIDNDVYDNKDKQDGKDSGIKLAHWDTFKGWGALLRTCTRLRALATQAQELWAYINSNWEDRTIDRHISRAGSHNLILDLDLDCARPAHVDAITTKLFAAAHAVQIIAARSKINIIVNTLRNPAPELMELQLLDYHENYMDNEQTSFQLDSTFLGGRSSSLRILHIVNGCFHKSSPVLSMLCYLGLDSMQIKEGFHVLARFLQSCSLLENLVLLRLQIVDAKNVRNNLTSKKPLILPHLRSIELEGSLDSVHSLICLLPNPHTRLSIQIDSEYSSNHPLHLPSSSATMDRQAAIYEFVRAFWTSTTGENQISSGGTLKGSDDSKQYDLTVCYHSNSHPPTKLLYKTACIFDGGDPLVAAVETLTVHWKDDDGFMKGTDFLLKTLQHSSSIKRINLTTSQFTKESDLEVFEMWLKMRAGYGHRLQFLHFFNCPNGIVPFANRLKEARDVVGEVTWARWPRQTARKGAPPSEPLWRAPLY
jgi:hypothetical protein